MRPNIGVRLWHSAWGVWVTTVPDRRYGQPVDDEVTVVLADRRKRIVKIADLSAGPPVTPARAG